jgi:cell wall-associated NlpC family hydrolase
VPPTRRRLRRLGLSGLLGAAATIFVLAPGTPAQADPTVDQINRRIKTESTRLERVVEAYNKTNEELKANLAAAAKLTADLQPLKAEMMAASARINELAVLAYKGGAFAEMSAVLTSENPSTVVDRLATLDQISKFEHGLITRYTDLKARHDARAKELAGLIADEKAKRASLAQQKKKIEADLKKLYEMRQRAYGRAQARAGGVSVSAPYVAGQAGKVVRFAYGALGKPYVWAADGPGGYDCSGLTLAAWRTVGVSLPHNAAMQWNALRHIGRGSLRPGDLVFYNGLGHVGLYVGAGKIIHAPTFGDVVKIASVDVMPPYGYARPG